jgi:hypothetical protein
MNAAEAASGDRELGLKILAGELENRDECIAIAQRIAGLLREHRASRRGAKNRIDGELEAAATEASASAAWISAQI